MFFWYENMFPFHHMCHHEGKGCLVLFISAVLDLETQLSNETKAGWLRHIGNYTVNNPV